MSVTHTCKPICNIIVCNMICRLWMMKMDEWNLPTGFVWSIISTWTSVYAVLSVILKLKYCFDISIYYLVLSSGWICSMCWKQIYDYSNYLFVGATGHTGTDIRNSYYHYNRVGDNTEQFSHGDNYTDFMSLFQDYADSDEEMKTRIVNSSDMKDDNQVRALSDILIG